MCLIQNIKIPKKKTKIIQKIHNNYNKNKRKFAAILLVSRQNSSRKFSSIRIHKKNSHIQIQENPRNEN